MQSKETVLRSLRTSPFAFVPVYGNHIGNLPGCTGSHGRHQARTAMTAASRAQTRTPLGCGREWSLARTLWVIQRTGASLAQLISGTNLTLWHQCAVGKLGVRLHRYHGTLHSVSAKNEAKLLFTMNTAHLKTRGLGRGSGLLFGSHHRLHCAAINLHP